MPVSYTHLDVYKRQPTVRISSSQTFAEPEKVSLALGTVPSVIGCTAMLRSVTA